MKELNDALRTFESSKEAGAIVITGNERAFAAGADIKEMKDITFADAFRNDFLKPWADITQITIPIIAAVNGYALGGGCELAMTADIIYCGPKAVFGQPEIKLGVIPGAGGTQRLVWAIGKAKAMEIILTGKSISAEEAVAWGLAARMFETPEGCVEAALDTAELIAGLGRLAVKAAKEAVNQSMENGLSEGVKYERRLFHSLFASRDQKIGMTAFVEKKKPQWTGE
ncbi:hypothetical protein Q9L58_008447 [Maublancomyces gigas]|uniref:Enoyl-CoA hydratase n=1 Tax=Discina gigas TaxID=1032678 RepID=A0ABR3G9V0_9PEZI